MLGLPNHLSGGGGTIRSGLEEEAGQSEGRGRECLSVPWSTSEATGVWKSRAVVMPRQEAQRCRSVCLQSPRAHILER